MTTFLVFLTLVIAILLVLLIMVQNPKGGGLSSTFGGGANIGGVQSTNTFLDKSTWTLAAVMIGLILLINITHPNRQGGILKSSIENTLDEGEAPAEKPAAPAATVPATPSSEQPAQ